jgi:hypothetical protein
MVYVDTSVIVALLTLEPATPAVMKWYAGLKELPVSSDWLLTEFSSALSIKLRSGQLSEAAARAVRREFLLLSSGGLRLVQVSRTAFKAAAEMSQSHKPGLRSGDSLHLAIAQEIGAKTIATLDGIMVKNAKRLKFKSVKF